MKGIQKWVIAVATTMILAYLGWAGTSVISNGERLSAVEVDHMNLRAWLERNESKLDKILERLPVR
jgi:hypothetical protein